MCFSHVPLFSFSVVFELKIANSSLVYQNRIFPEVYYKGNFYYLSFKFQNGK